MDDSTAIEPVEGRTATLSMQELHMGIATHIDSIEPEANPGGDAFATFLQMKEFKQLATDLHKMASDKLVECLEAHDKGGKPAEIVMGEMRYRAQYPKKNVTKLDIKGMIRAIFEHLGGDIDDFLGVLPAILSSSAFKQGEIKSLWPELWGALYEVDYGQKIDETKPRKRKLEEVNTFFVDSVVRRRESLEAQRAAEPNAETG